MHRRCLFSEKRLWNSQSKCSEMTYPDKEGPLPEICSLWDKHIRSLRLCSDKSECSDTCDFHPGTRQYLENMHLTTI